MNLRDWVWALLVGVGAIGQVIGAATISIDAFTGDTYGSLVVFTQPAPFIFSIWGLIYLLCFVFAIYQLIPSQNSPYLQYARPRVFLAFAGTVVWLWFAGQDLSLVWATAPLLAAIAWLLWQAISFQVPAEGKTTLERFAGAYTLYPFAAWTLIATGVNIHSMLLQYQLIPNLFTNVFISIFVLVAIAIFSILVLRQVQYSPWFGGVFVWAAFGVAAANIIKEDGAWLVAVLAGLFALYVFGMLVTNNTVKRD